MRNDTDYAPGSGPSDPEHHDSTEADPTATDSTATDSTTDEHTSFEHTAHEDGSSGYAPTDPELANADEAAAASPDDERLFTDTDRTDPDAERADEDADPDAERADEEQPYLATGDAAEDSAYPVSDEPDDGAEESYGSSGRAALDDGDTDDRADAYDEALDDEPVAGQASAGDDAEDDEAESDEAEGRYNAAIPAQAGADEEHPVVDNFVDETSGADPYATPEPVDTSGPVASVDGSDAQRYDQESAESTRDADSADALAEMQTAEAMGLSGAAAGVGFLTASRASADDQAPADEDEQALASDADEAQPAHHDELMPGEAELAPMAVVITAADADRLRERWQQLQMRFIDDPQGTADAAQGLVGEVVQTLTAALASQRDALEDWRGSATGDTEILRAAMMRYRDFFDRLLSL